MNDNKHYTLEELVNNSEFINWVKNDMPTESKWSAFKSDQSDFESIKQKAVELVKSIQFEEESNTPVVKADIWSKIDTTISKDSNPEKISTSESIPTRKEAKIRPLYWMSAAAASIAACVLFLFVFNSGDSTNSIKEVYSADAIIDHSLPDKSVIELTQGSHITYQEDDWSDNRNVVLDGEAFFNVEKGQSFTVKTNDATVVVLGTSFNIKETDDGTEVICKTGKVKVISNSTQDEETIVANELVNIKAGKVSKQVHSNVFIPWKEDNFLFNDIALGDVFKQIETEFKVNIQVDPRILNKEFNGDFEKSKLEDALHNICWPMKLQYTIDGTNVVIKSTE